MLKTLLFLLALIPMSARSQPPKGLLSEEQFETIFRIHSDSGIWGQKYNQIQQELKDLEKAYPDFATYFTYGITPQGRELSGIKIENKMHSRPTSASAIYIGGTIHGNEYLNIEDRLPRWILDFGKNESVIQDYLNRGGAFYLVPILNPDGYEHRKRENNNGSDLNRDYTVQAARVTGFRQPETRLWVDFLEKDLATTQRSLKFALDYHCCIGALLYPWSFETNLRLASETLAKYEHVGRLMKTALGTSYKVGQTPVILGYSAKGTSKDYYHEHFGALGFTFEGEQGIENRNFEKHTQFLVSVIKELKL